MTPRPAEKTSKRPPSPQRRPRPANGAAVTRTRKPIARPGRVAAPSPPPPGGKNPPRVDRELFRRSSGRRASAGRVLAVGLICFGLWTLFDANQLYHNALSSPFGTRRSVSLAILRPIAAVTNALGLSGPVNAADSALGRGGRASSATLPPVPVVVPTGRAANDSSIWGMAPRPHSGGRYVPPPKTVWPPALAPPTRAHPLEILDIGDSIGEDLGYGLGDLFGNDPYVRVLQRGKIDTGLARPDYYNWPAMLERYLRTYHPGAVVIMMGANDDQSLSLANGAAVSAGTRRWNEVYRSRIALMMDEVLAAGAHLVWVGLPPVSAPSVNNAFVERVNGMAKVLAAGRYGVTYVSTWKLLSGPHGGFTQYKQLNGSVQQIRYSDGVHLAPAGWDLLASYLLKPMERAWHVKLHARPLFKVG